MHIFCNVFVRVGVQNNGGLVKWEGVPSSTLSKLPIPFADLCCPFHLLNVIMTETKSGCTQPLKGMHKAKTAVLFPTRYKEKQ